MSFMMHSLILCSVFFILTTIFATAQRVTSGKPNIVLILTDDQDSVLGGITPMRRTQDLVGKNGVTFVNSFVATPLCCPSRASILTGMFPHNHGTRNNSLSGGCSSQQWQQNHEPNTFAAILKNKTNYETFYAGKYLNEYGRESCGGPQHVPTGWDVWRGLVGNSKYYNFTLSHDGEPIEYTNGEYLTDVIKEMAMDYIDKISSNANPFLMVVSPPAPHSPFLPADRHKNMFVGLKAVNTPNFNVPATKDKHWIMQMQPSPLSNSTLVKLDAVYRARWQTLLAVDELVEEIVKKLSSVGQLDNTYIIVTSDNGYHIGQFSQPIDKRQPYETDIRVPLLIRGPGIAPLTVLPHPVINVDLAPTILKMAGLESATEEMDGLTMPIFTSSSSNVNIQDMIETNEVDSSALYDRLMLVEYSGEGLSDESPCPVGNDHNLYNCDIEYECKCEDSRNNTYGCVRHLHPTIDILYCAFNDTKDTEEAYNVLTDPYQMDNIINGMMPAIKFKYQNTLQHLLQCKGDQCNTYLHHFD